MIVTYRGRTTYFGYDVTKLCDGVYCTAHAAQRMKERHITPKEVAESVASPINTAPYGDGGNLMRRIGQFGRRRFVFVTVATSGEDVVVTTVFVKRRLQKP